MQFEFIRGASLNIDEPRPVDLAAQVQAAREYVKRHPALTPRDLAEFDVFLKHHRGFTKFINLSAEDAR